LTLRRTIPIDANCAEIGLNKVYNEFIQNPAISFNETQVVPNRRDEN
jgi:hypothetical protein